MVELPGVGQLVGHVFRVNDETIIASVYNQHGLFDLRQTSGRMGKRPPKLE